MERKIKVVGRRKRRQRGEKREGKKKVEYRKRNMMMKNIIRQERE